MTALNRAPGALFSAIMSTGRICPCLTEAAPAEADPAAAPAGGGAVMAEGNGGGGSVGDQGPDNDVGQAENTVRRYAGKLRAFSLSFRNSHVTLSGIEPPTFRMEGGGSND